MPTILVENNRIYNYMRQYLVKHAARLFKGRHVNYKPLLVPSRDDYPLCSGVKLTRLATRPARYGTTIMRGAICPKTSVTTVWWVFGFIFAVSG